MACAGPEEAEDVGEFAHRGEQAHDEIEGAALNAAFEGLLGEDADDATLNGGHGEHDEEGGDDFPREGEARGGSDLRGYEKGSQANGGLSEKLQRRECADESHVWPTGASVRGGGG